LYGILWRARWFLALFTLVPSLVFGCYIYFSPRSYRAQLHYPMVLTGTDLQKWLGRFYSGENMQRLIANLRTDGLSELPDDLDEADSEADLRDVIDVEVLPDYIDFANRKNMKLSLQRSWAENIEKIEQLTAQLVSIRIEGSPKSELVKSVAWVRRNLELEMPLYELMDGTRKRITNLNAELAAIEEARDSNRLALERSRVILAGLEADWAKTGATGVKAEVQLSLKDIEKESPYLPLSLQIQSYQSEATRLAAFMADGERQHELKTRLRTLFGTLYGELAAKIDQSDYSLDHYRAFLDTLIASPASEAEANMLAAHRNLVENMALERTPLTSGERVQPMARGTIGKTALLFTALLIVGIFICCLNENLRSQTVE